MTAERENEAAVRFLEKRGDAYAVALSRTKRAIELTQQHHGPECDDSALVGVVRPEEIKCPTCELMATLTEVLQRTAADVNGLTREFQKAVQS